MRHKSEPTRREPRSTARESHASRKRREARVAALEAAAFKEMVRQHWAIPSLGLLAILFIGATRFEESRTVLASVIALGAPVVAMGVAAAPSRESHPTFRALVFTVAGIVALGTTARIAPAVIATAPPATIAPLVSAASAPGFPAVLLFIALTTVPLEAFAVKRGVGSRFAGLAGIAVTMALYLPSHWSPEDPFGGVLACFLVALFIGGGVGLVLGSVARAATGSRM